MAETTLTRRSFVKASALVGATAAFGASMAGCMQEAPQEQAPSGGGADEGLVRMKTSCHGCIQMCPAIAYLKDGVVVKLEGDPDAPVSRGKPVHQGPQPAAHHVQPPPRAASASACRRARREQMGGHQLGRGRRGSGHAYLRRHRQIRPLFLLRQRGRRRGLLVHGGHDPAHGVRVAHRVRARLRPVLSAALEHVETVLRRQRPVHRRQRRAGDIPSRPRQQGRGRGAVGRPAFRQPDGGIGSRNGRAARQGREDHRGRSQLLARRGEGRRVAAGAPGHRHGSAPVLVPLHLREQALRRAVHEVLDEPALPYRPRDEAAGEGAGAVPRLPADHAPRTPRPTSATTSRRTQWRPSSSPRPPTPQWTPRSSGRATSKGRRTRPPARSTRKKPIPGRSSTPPRTAGSMPARSKKPSRSTPRPPWPASPTAWRRI